MRSHRGSSAAVAALVIVMAWGIAAAPARAQGARWPDPPLPDSANDFTTLSEDGFEPYEYALYGKGDEFVIATILSVRDSGATNAHPPRVTIRVHEILRGAVKPGRHEIEWLPAEVYMPCSVGEEGNVARWGATPLRGPTVGARLILSGRGRESGLWGADVWSRFPATDSTRAHVLARLRTWQPHYEARMAWELSEAKPAAARAKVEAKANAEAAAVAARAARLASERQAAADRAWFEVERDFRSDADIEQLVRTSDLIVVATVAGVNRRGPPWSGLDLAAESWLVRPVEGRPGSMSEKTFVVAFGAREDSLFCRWERVPADDRPGTAIGEPVRVIAFLREPTAGFRYDQWVAFPTDPECGLVRADEALLGRVKAALARFRAGGAAATPIAACGAGLSEFAVRDTLEAMGVGLRMDAVASFNGQSMERALVVGSAGGPLDPGWFTTCAGPDPQFDPLARGVGQNVRIRPSEMKALLDVFTASTLPADGRADARDPARLILRRVVDGRERVYETTVDRTTLGAIGRTMESIVRGERARLTQWWRFTDDSVGKLFRNSVAVELPSPPPPPSRVPESSLP